MITTQHCAECARLATLADLRSAMQTARENGSADMAEGYWQDIKFHQKHEYVHTCGGGR